MSSFSTRGNTVLGPVVLLSRMNLKPNPSVYSKHMCFEQKQENRRRYCLTARFSCSRRYKLLELLGYVAMGAVPALVILSMVRGKNSPKVSVALLLCDRKQTSGSPLNRFPAIVQESLGQYLKKQTSGFVLFLAHITYKSLTGCRF